MTGVAAEKFNMCKKMLNCDYLVKVDHVDGISRSCEWYKQLVKVGISGW